MTNDDTHNSGGDGKLKSFKITGKNLTSLTWELNPENIYFQNCTTYEEGTQVSHTSGRDMEKYLLDNDLKHEIKESCPFNWTDTVNQFRPLAYQSVNGLTDEKKSKDH